MFFVDYFIFMFKFQRMIYLRETDATGRLYFATLLELGLEAFERFLSKKKFTLQRMLEEECFTMPIVHSEADYFLPLCVGDAIEIALSCEKIGNSSFTMKTSLLKEGKEAGIVKIVHVAVGNETQKSTPLPESLLDHLRELQIDTLCRDRDFDRHLESGKLSS